MKTSSEHYMPQVPAAEGRKRSGTVDAFFGTQPLARWIAAVSVAVFLMPCVSQASEPPPPKAYLTDLVSERSEFDSTPADSPAPMLICSRDEQGMVDLEIKLVPLPSSGVYQWTIKKGTDVNAPNVANGELKYDSDPNKRFKEKKEDLDLDPDLHVLWVTKGAYTRRIDLLPMDLAVDTDRSGTIDRGADNAEEDKWTKERGAIYTVNFDRDGDNAFDGENRPDAIHFTDDGTSSDENWKIENADDEDDITPLVIAAMDGLSGDFKVFLKVEEAEDMRAIHLYKKIEAGEDAVWGSHTDPALAPWAGDDDNPTDLEIEITKWVNVNAPDYAETRDAGSGDYIFGIEGLVLRGMEIDQGLLHEETEIAHHSGKFSGEIQFTLVLKHENEEIELDVVRLRVAPWIAQWNSLPSKELFIADEGAGNASFLAALGASATAVQAPDQWIQDHVEIGYTQRPGGPPMELMFRMPRLRDDNCDGVEDALANWPMNQFLGKNKGVFQIGVKSQYDFASTQYGGNFEVLPPNSHWPLGRSLLGGKQIDDDLQTFFEVQEIQEFGPHEGWEQFGFEVDWLRVAHLDEVFGFIDSNEVAIADPAKAITLLESIPVAQRGSTLLFASQSGTKLGVMPAGQSASVGYLNTGVDHSGDTAYNYIRFYDGDLKGVVCRISSHGNGLLGVDRVWQTGQSGIINGDPESANQADWDYYAWKEHWLGSYQVDAQGSWVLDTNGNPIPEAPPLLSPEIQSMGGSKYVMFEDTQFWGSVGNLVSWEVDAQGNPISDYFDYDGMPAAVTVEELLADAVFLNAHKIENGYFRRAISKCESTLVSANREPIAFLRLPVLFLGKNLDEPYDDFLIAHTSEAFTPGASNFQTTGGAVGNIFMPKQFGPLVGGVDIFEQEITNEFTGNQVNFIDVWYLYHAQVGEVHCGTSFRRVSPSNKDWWQNQPE